MDARGFTKGELAQSEARVVRNDEVGGSKPPFSSFTFFLHTSLKIQKKKTEKKKTIL